MSDYNNGNQGPWTTGAGRPEPVSRRSRSTGSHEAGPAQAQKRLCHRLHDLRDLRDPLCLCCLAFPLAIILGVGAVCFAIISKRGQPFYATAIFGIVLGVIAVVLGIGEFVYFMALSSLVKDPANAALINEFMEQLEQQLQQQGQSLPTV